MTTRLAELCRDLEPGLGPVRADAWAGSLEDVSVSAVTIDSRRVSGGTLFVACPGVTPTSKDGHDFIDVAVRNGAAALVVSDPARAVAHRAALPIFVVKDTRRAAAVLAERVVGEPSRALTVVGVTGTNGKTTTTWLLAQIFAAAGKKSAVLGTLGVGPVDDIRPLGFTTPEAEVLSRELSHLHRDGIEVVAMEVSSHALATARIDGIKLAAAGFTNLTRDHLDFHGNMEAYFEAKARLFTDPFGAAGGHVPATIPAFDDEEGWHGRLRARRADAVTWGPGGMLSAVDVEAASSGMRGALVFQGKRVPFTSPLLGGYNVENLLVATGLAMQCGLTLDEVAAALATATAPPGRLERVPSEPGQPLVVVDYAHTPDALERALMVLRPLTAGRLIVVFGAGGNRDPGKRPIMGRIAGEVADVVVVTDDNPRSENGDAIADQILAGVPPHMQRVEPEQLAADAGKNVVARIRARRMAIRAAIAGAHDDDTVVIAGKGHEHTQTWAVPAATPGGAPRTIVAPFDDVAESVRALRGEGSPALLEAAFVTEALADRGVVVDGALPPILNGVATDSRKVAPGALFVALAGDRFDGHTFVAHVLAGGPDHDGPGQTDRGDRAGAALIADDKQADLAGMGPLVVVDDTLRALQDLARAHVARLPATRIALTGSNGKTTTKELLAACLREALGGPWVLATEGNLNNHIGVPLTALRAEPEHKALVFEMGMNHLGEIALLADIVRPTVGLVTNMGTAHAGNLPGGVEGVARAKAELFEALPKHGVAVVNADDARCVREAQRAAKCRQLSFGAASWADVRLVSVTDRETGGQELELSYGGKTVETSIPLEGRHNAGNAAGAVAAAIAAGVPFDVAARGLASTHHAHGRLERFVLAGGVWLLDDTYNANPDSMEAALIALADLAGTRRKVVVLGEMRELGEFAESAHRHIGAAVAQSKASALFACGALGKLYGEGAVAAGLSGSAVVWADTNAALARLVASAIRPGDVVLVKGSRGARMEVVVEALRQAHTGAKD